MSLPFRGPLLAVLAFAISGCATMSAEAPAPAAPAMTAEQEEALYLERLRKLTGGQGLDGYDPMEAVPGAANPAPLPKATAAERTISDEALARARAYAQANNSSALLIWRNGKLELAEYFGEAGPQTEMVSRSLAKPLTAIAVGRALALGKIRSLDQPVADFIHEWRGTPKAAMTIRHLLDMRTGLLAQGFDPDPANIWNRTYLHPRHAEIIINEYPLTHAPGTRYDYSNATSELVAVVIERATGRRYAEFISNEVLKPLGAMGGEVWINRPGGTAHSGCCIELPAETYLKLGVLLLEDGRWNGRRLLPAGYVAEMRRGTPQNPYYGLGVYVAGPYTERRGFANADVPAPKVLHSEPYLAGDLFLFDGNANQTLFLVPSENLAILRLGGPPPRQPEWDNTVLPNTIMRGIKRRPGETPPPAQARSGASNG